MRARSRVDAQCFLDGAPELQDLLDRLIDAVARGDVDVHRVGLVVAGGCDLERRVLHHLEDAASWYRI